MADTKTSLEAAAAALDGTELIRGVQAGANVKMTAQAIAARALLDPGFAEAVQDVVGAFISASNGVRATYDDTANTLTFDAQETVNAQTGTSYTFVTGDRGKLVTFSNASAIAGTLPQAGSAGFPAGWWCDVQNRGAGTETTTPTTSTIDGAASLALTTGQGTRLVSDGTNWFTQRGVGSAAAGGTELKYLTLQSNTSSTADSDPGNGLMKWNNATQASATVLFLDNQTLDAVSLTTFYASLVLGGFIYLQQSDDATKWQIWKVSTVTSATGYYKFTVVLQAFGGSIATDKTVYVLFQNGAASATAPSKTYAVCTPMTSQPPATDYATLDTRNSIAVLKCPPSVDSGAYWDLIMPEGAVLGSGLKIRVHTMSDGTSGNARLLVKVEADGTDADTDSFDTDAQANATANATSGIPTVTEITLTTIDSLAAGGGYRLYVGRKGTDATNDTMTSFNLQIRKVEVRSAA